ncbi:MAG: DUF4831 family protein [Bacteroidales bacterium]|nr:DUF4831 family protein [Bacteroidales bacterium]
MKLYHKFLLLICLIIVACSAPNELAYIKVENLNESKTNINNHLIYALPQTILKLDFEIQKLTKIKGPYSKFAEKYLSITEVISENSEKWTITNVKISSNAEPDTNHFYTIETNGNYINSINLSDCGLILSVNKDEYNDNIFNYQKENYINNPEKDFFYKDLSVKKNVYEKITTTYKNVVTDTSFVKIPVTQKSIVNKSLEKKAEEAVNFIIKLRKRKFKLMAGMNDNYPDGNNIGTMIKELKDLEDEYILLFTGKTLKENIKYSAECIPDKYNETNNYTLFYFSPKKGILTIQELSRKTKFEKGMNIRPVNINIAANIDYLNKFDTIASDTNIMNTGICYRIPVVSNIEVYYGNNLLVSDKKLIAQFGKIVRLPDYIDNKYSIEFYEKYGSLKSIQKK